MKIRKGKGVLCKDNKTPWAAGTLHYTRMVDRDGDGRLWAFKSPCEYTMENMAMLIDMLHKGQVTEVQLIDPNNNQFIYELTAAEKRALNR